MNPWSSLPSSIYTPAAISPRLTASLLFDTISGSTELSTDTPEVPYG